ncbi:hypothetical protein E4T39_08154 [Aureobasidium subglaciale]|nr:hypothetical protein E4T39_08154 [Aureobasidium subglaciale]
MLLASIPTLVRKRESSTKRLIRGKSGVEDFKGIYQIEKINIPTYIVASYSSFVHAMGSIRGLDATRHRELVARMRTLPRVV